MGLICVMRALAHDREVAPTERDVELFRWPSVWGRMLGRPLELARRTLPIAAVLALAPSLAEANQDSVYGTRGDAQMREVGHTIDMSFERGYATLTIERTVHNGIDRHDEAQFWLYLPWEGVATGLRSLGEVDGRPKWFDAELLEAEAAAARYRELTGLGAYYPKDPALLSWRHQSHLALQVFPVAPHTNKTIEYTVEMPAVWEDGRWHLSLPAMGTPEMPAELRINPEQALDQLFVDGEVVARGHYERLDHELALSLAPRDPDPVVLELASASTGSRALVHWSVTLAPELSEVPERAQIVLVLDLSKSAESSLEAQRELALAYLDHFQDGALGAQVAVLGFDREVHSLTPGLVSAREASEALRGASLRVRNGSEIGLALDTASKLLASQKARGPERIVVLGDFETAQRLTPESVAATSKLGDALVHFVEIDGDYADLQRVDGHQWASIPAQTGGVAWFGSALGEWDEPGSESFAESIEVFEELVRPIRVDNFHASIPGLDIVEGEGIGSYVNGAPLDEGQGIQGTVIATAGAKHLVVEGLLWNMPLNESVRPSRKASDRWSALAFGQDEIHPYLGEDEMMVLAMRGGAVSPVTSYLAIEPGVRPSTEGIERESGWMGFGSGSGGGFGSASGFAARGARAPSFDKREWLESELEEGWRRCGGEGIAAEVKLETMTTELLEVELQTKANDAALRSCMEQVTWSLDLPSLFGSREHWTIRL